MLWREFRRDVTHCELFESTKALSAATLAFFEGCNANQRRVLSIIGSNAA
jgi:putative transposase